MRCCSDSQTRYAKWAPDATGAPVLDLGNPDAPSSIAFIQAGLLSFAAVVILLMLALKSLRDVILTLGPLLAACVLTFATCVVLGLPLNFANIIVLPLLLGIGVAFHIIFRDGLARRVAMIFLQSSLSRAVLFSALTTATGFRHAVAVASSRHREHGRIVDDFARLDARDPDHSSCAIRDGEGALAARHLLVDEIVDFLDEARSTRTGDSGRKIRNA